MIMNFPPHNAREVVEIANRLQACTSSDTEFSRYLRGYFPQNLRRLAMNILFLKKQLKPGSRWLDVGSLGVEAAFLKSLDPQLNVNALSLEGNLVGIEDGRFTDNPGRAHAVRIEHVDVEREPFPFREDLFDLVTCFEVVEHLKFSPVPVIREIKRVLKPEGRAVLTTPNVTSHFSVRRILSGSSPLQCPYYHRSAGLGIIHPREYTAEEVRELLASQGLDLLHLTSFNLRSMTTVDRMVASLCALLELARNLVKSERKYFHRGENILAIAGKGGPVLSETPQAIFGAPEGDNEPCNQGET
jgi:SAM-dependent methyltransferase